MSTADIRIRSMTLEDYKEVRSFLGKHFHTDEPLSVASGITMDSISKRHEDYHNSLIEQGTCIVAVDERNAGRIVGLILAGAQFPSELEENRKAVKNHGHIFGLMSKVETAANVYERYNVPKALYLHIISVDSCLRGKGLGKRLVTAIMDLGRTKGFPLLVAYCSSFYAARQMEAMGMECAHALAYTDYTSDQGEVIFRTAPPHTHIRVMISRL